MSTAEVWLAGVGWACTLAKGLVTRSGGGGAGGFAGDGIECQSKYEATEVESSASADSVGARSPASRSAASPSPASVYGLLAARLRYTPLSESLSGVELATPPVVSPLPEGVCVYAEGVG